MTQKELAKLKVGDLVAIGGNSQDKNRVCRVKSICIRRVLVESITDKPLGDRLWFDYRDKKPTDNSRWYSYCVLRKL